MTDAKFTRWLITLEDILWIGKMIGGEGCAVSVPWVMVDKSRRHLLRRHVPSYLRGTVVPTEGKNGFVVDTGRARFESGRALPVYRHKKVKNPLPEDP